MIETKRLARRKAKAGHAVIEACFLLPWIFFLFVGALDVGFFSYALLATENAARVGALYTAQCRGTLGDQAAACEKARVELAALPNSRQFGTSCTSGPLVVTTAAIVDSEGLPASRVQVRYQTIPLIPIPGVLPGRLTITRTAEVRVFGD